MCNNTLVSGHRFELAGNGQPVRAGWEQVWSSKRQAGAVATWWPAGICAGVACTLPLAVGAKPFSSRPVQRRSAALRGFTAPSRAPKIATMASSRTELHSLPGVSMPPPETKGFFFQQTMLRVKDPKNSLDFYTRVMGMTLLCKLDFADMAFSLYFLGYAAPEEVPDDPVERAKWMFGLPACLELTHNWGTESDPEFKGYHNGNSDPRGFGHIGLVVPDVEAACKRFEELGVEFVKRPNDGKMRNIAFVKDPDGYWIEILTPDNSKMFVEWNQLQQQQQA